MGRTFSLSLVFLLLISKSYSDTTKYKLHPAFQVNIGQYSSLDGSYDVLSSNLLTPPEIGIMFLNKKEYGLSICYQLYNRRKREQPELSKVIRQPYMHLIEINAWIPLIKNQGNPWLWYRSGLIYRYGGLMLNNGASSTLSPLPGVATYYLSDLGMNNGLVARFPIWKRLKGTYSLDWAYFAIKGIGVDNFWLDFTGLQPDPRLDFHIKNSLGISYWW